jgi:hypothetical protein
MRQLEFAYAVSAEVEFTLDEIEHLIALSVRHYDGYCKSVGQVGGFLYGYHVAMTMGVNHPDDDPPIEPPPRRVSAHEADTMCKLLELPSADPELAHSMRTLLANLNAETRRVNGGSQ